jgi:hypothetical protein
MPILSSISVLVKQTRDRTNISDRLLELFELGREVLLLLRQAHFFFLELLRVLDERVCDLLYFLAECQRQRPYQKPRYTYSIGRKFLIITFLQIIYFG